MCNDCGCSGRGDDVEVKGDGRTVPVMTSLLQDNDRRAAHNRAHFGANGTLCINLMSSPGSGKTSLLEATIDALGHTYRIAVIEGDLATENDAVRIRAKNVPAVQITTGQACHLDAGMVHEGLHQLDLAQTDILFIENVGNLVCPAGFDLGQHANVVLLSVTEGDDKPAKYPVMFRAADLVLLSKSDLLDVIDDFDPARAEGYVRNLASPAPVMQVSARRADTLRSWTEWLAASLERLHKQPDAAEQSGMPDARTWLDQIRALPLPSRIRVMNVCGGHERSISMAGLRGVLPESIELIPGPGCPVCVCPEEDIYEAIRLAMKPGVRLVTFGDMLRVPANVPKREPRSLEQARAAGGDVIPIATPQEAVRIALSHPDEDIVFFAAGFETTIAPVAGLVAEGLPDNLSILLAGRLTWPAVSMLLDSEKPGFDALIAPGHVATVMGPGEWTFVVRDHGIPAAIAGFETESFLAALHSVLKQDIEGAACLDNCYANVVRPGGNPTARRLLDETMDIVDANWRGIGTIPASGFALKPHLARHDTRERFGVDAERTGKRIGEMPPGCDCARVVLGKVYPSQCALFGTACTPRNPIGPCMVSDEGACHIWWTSGIRSDAERQPAGF